MKPVVALIGRPNVGKSTLFNRLTRTRAALVVNTPGMTRDRQYGDGRIGDRPYFVVDTGGVVSALEENSSRETLPGSILAQTKQALAEADAAIFLVDGREGLQPADLELGAQLRKLNKPLWLVVNKTEDMDADIAIAEFHALGLGQPFPISAEHGGGIEELMEQVLAGLAHVEETQAQRAVPHVAVIGRPNVGKSSLVNALLGEDRVVVSDAPGTTRDAIHVPFERDGSHYVLIDTAGVRRKMRVRETLEKFSVIKTLHAVNDADVVLLLIDAVEGVTEQDAGLAGYVLEHGRAVVVALNKWDLLDRGERAWALQHATRKLAFLEFARLQCISALHGTGVSALFGLIDRAHSSAWREMPTSKLNQIVQAAVQATPPPVHRGRRIRIKYAHQGGKNPPRVIVHGNQVQVLSVSYKRYLARAVRRAFRLDGVPVLVECRQEHNPYAGAKNGKPRRGKAKRSK